MRYRLAFTQVESGQLLVLAEVVDAFSLEQKGFFSTRYDDENNFLYNAVFADLEVETTTTLIANVLLVMSGEKQISEWVLVQSDESQFRTLGLTSPRPGDVFGQSVAAGLPDEGDLRDTLMQAPTPIAMLVGPEHRFTFINPAYVRVMGRLSAESVLGKTVREALPELEDQPFLDLLDKVYRTGEPFIGINLAARLLNEAAGELADHFFDLIYQPVRNERGAIYGILAQANNVTERVQASLVHEAQEAMLYRQLAELEAIYDVCPIGLTLVDARTCRILRINDLSAAILGVPASEALGKIIFDVRPELVELLDIYNRAASGETVRNVRIDLPEKSNSAKIREWQLTLAPILDSFGKVDSIAQIAVPISKVSRADDMTLFDLEVLD